MWSLLALARAAAASAIGRQAQVRVADIPATGIPATGIPARPIEAVAAPLASAVPVELVVSAEPPVETGPPEPLESLEFPDLSRPAADPLEYTLDETWGERYGYEHWEGVVCEMMRREVCRKRGIKNHSTVCPSGVWDQTARTVNFLNWYRERHEALPGDYPAELTPKALKVYYYEYCAKHRRKPALPTDLVQDLATRGIRTVLSAPGVPAAYLMAGPRILNRKDRLGVLARKRQQESRVETQREIQLATRGANMVPAARYEISRNTPRNAPRTASSVTPLQPLPKPLSRAA